ncbi:MAG: protein kinase [Vicinamibacteria bacterium]
MTERDPDLAREVRSLLGWHQESLGDNTPSGGSRVRLESGTRLGPYEIEDLLDAGGMGAVYRAKDTRLNRAVAVKVIDVSARGGPEVIRRFEREARTIASLSHPNILSIFDYGRHEEVAYAVTELLEGENLRGLLRHGPLPVTRALSLTRQIASGLADAHSKGIVHRDLKPENVFLCVDGVVKVLDFGLAKQTWAHDALGSPHTVETRAGLLLGTVGYMAPEQVRGQDVDARADVFALGVVLHELLTGKRPFDRDTPAETLAAVLRDEVPSYQESAMPWPLADVLRRCLAKDRDARFASASAFLQRLDAISLPTSQTARVVWTRRAALAGIATITLATIRPAGLSRQIRPRPVDRVTSVGIRPDGIVFQEDNVWVANRDSNNLTRIRARDGEITGTFAVGEWPGPITWDGQAIWVANHKWLTNDHSTLMRLDPIDGRVLNTYKLPGQPVCVTADQNFLWVTETWPTYLLRKLRLSDGGEVAAFTAGGIPRNTVTDGESVWVANGPIGSLTKIRATDGKLLGAVTIEGKPNMLRRVGPHLWLNNNHADPAKEALFKVKADDLTIVSKYGTPNARGCAGSEKWFFVAEAGQISQKRVSDGQLVATWAGGPESVALEFDRGNLWVMDFQSNTVSTISARSLADADRG